MFSQIRETRLHVIIIFIVAQIALSMLANLVFFPRGAFDGIHRVTGGLINPTLSNNLMWLLLVVMGLFFGIGKLRPGDVGLLREKVLPAVFVTLGMWILMQLILIAACLFSEGSLAWHKSWEEKGGLVVMGILLGQLLGNALYEEIAFRGFLLPQVYFKCGGMRDSLSTRHLGAALLISQLIFSLIHIPNRLMKGVMGAPLLIDLLMLIVMGILFALLYLRTKNLLVAVGVHAILNYPTPLVAANVNEQLVVAGLMLLLLISWPIWVGWFRSSVERNDA